jgi:hypothetical protein
VEARARHGNDLSIDADDHAHLLVAGILYEHESDFTLTAEDAFELTFSRH